GRGLLHLGEDGLRLRREVKAHGAAIRRIRPSLDPSGGLHTIDQPRQRDRLDLEALRELALLESLRAPQMRERAPLRLAQAKRLRAPVETATQQGRDVGDQKADAAFRLDVRRNRRTCPIGKQAYIKLAASLRQFRSV